MRSRALVAVTAVALLLAHLVALAQGIAFAGGHCDCHHGPDVPCDCPHHPVSAQRLDDELPPCHRAPARATTSPPDGSELRNRCGTTAAELVLMASMPMPKVGPFCPPEATAAPAPPSPRSPPAFMPEIDPPPPRTARS